MRFSVLAWFAITLSFATNSSAATLTVTPDATSYTPGAPITLFVVGTINHQTELATNISVSLVFTNAGFVDSVAETATGGSPFNPLPWTVGAAQGSFAGNSLMVFSQFEGLPPGGSFLNNMMGSSASIAGIVVAEAGSPGTASFDFGPLTNFFDVQGAGPGTTVNIVPEPSSVSLLALGRGLSGVALRRST